MRLKETLAWARSQWGIFQRDDMSAQEVLRWFLYWVPFGARTAGFGTLSLALGPLTRDHRASTWAMKRWSQVSLDKLGIRTTVSGTDGVPTGGHMYASNHQSLLDILVLGACLPGDIKWAAKRSILRVPFLGWHLALSGHVPVDRQAGKMAAVEVIRRLEAVMRAGKPLLIFPEGTRSEDGQVKDFKDGGFYAAVRAGKPVVPVVVDGTYQIMGKHALDIGEMAARNSAIQRHVHIVIGAPLHAQPDGSDRERVGELRDRCRQTIIAMLASVRARGGGEAGA